MRSEELIIRELEWYIAHDYHDKNAFLEVRNALLWVLEKRDKCRHTGE